MKYHFTPKTYAELKARVDKARDKADDIAGSGFKSGAEQDGHHDEGYQLSLRETAVHDNMANELARVLTNAVVVQPVEQNETVQFGNIIEIIFSEDDREQYLIESFVLPGSENSLSMNSPLGQAVIGARSGEIRSYMVDGRTITVTIGKILPPSVSN